MDNKTNNFHKFIENELNDFPDYMKKFNYLINNVEIMCKLFKFGLQNLNMKVNHLFN